jgi:hypothetical protein
MSRRIDVTRACWSDISRNRAKDRSIASGTSAKDARFTGISLDGVPTMRKTARNSTSDLARYSAVIAAFLLLPTAASHAAEESKSENIGPWEIEATFKGDKFDRCSIDRTLQDDIKATFVRTGDGLTLELESPNWKLERGKQYPVKMTLGPVSFDTEVAAEPNSVSVDVKDKKFSASLRTASALNIIAAGATIRVPLDSSTVAFDRLEKCVEKNNRAVETNPFVAPARQP